MMIPWNTEDDREGPGPAEEGDIQMEYCCDWLYSLIIGAVTKYYIKNLGHYREELKQSLYWPGQALRVPGGWYSQNC